MERTVTPHEAAVLTWLLDNAPKGDVSAYRIQPVEELRVLEKTCNCGCSSMDFQPGGWAGARIIADGLAVYPDGQQAGLILWGRDGNIVLLEVHDMHPNSSHRFPELADLRNYYG
jgi:hypothetical protein